MTACFTLVNDRTPLFAIIMSNIPPKWEQCLSLAQNISAPVPLLGAHRALGATLYWLGEFAAAQEHLTQGLALYDFQQHHALAFSYGVDPGVGCLFRREVPLTRERAEAVMLLSTVQGFPFTGAWGTVWRG